ncbi:hypothetical protein EON81_18425 [bacterium]|nr:MAG: hypothetical protein EON81_18425 [bacterium]
MKTCGGGDSVSPLCPLEREHGAPARTDRVNPRTMSFLTPLLLSLALSQAVRPQPEVGFVWHYPFVDKGTVEIPKTGTDSMIARAAWSSLQPEEGRYDWSNLDRQLAEARKGGYKLVLLLEANQFCAPAWVVKKAGDADENVRDASGNVAGGPHGAIPGPDSATFDRLQSAYLKALTDYVKKADPEGTITTYQPGIEWWFPYEWRHAPADVARFQAWMKGRYGSIGEVNRVWNAAYPNFKAIEDPAFDAPKVYQKARTGLAPLRILGEKRSYRNPAAAWYDWSKYWESVAARTIGGLSAKVKALDPSRPTMSWITNSYAFGSQWDYVQWSSVPMDAVARNAPGVDVLGLQLASSYGDPYQISFGLDVARKYGKPMSVLDLLDFLRSS